MAESYGRNEIKVGIMVIAALVVMGIFFAAVLGIRPGDQNRYHTWFKSVSGLEKGSEVTYAGYKVGRVTRVEVDEERDGMLHVAFAVGTDIGLHEGTLATIEAPIFGSTTLELVPGDYSSGLLEDGEELPSQEPFNMTAALRKVERLIETAEGTVEKLTANLEGATEQVQSVLAGVEDLLKDENRALVDNMLSEIDGMIVETRPKVREVMDRISTASAKLDRTVKSAEEALETAKGLMSDNREELEEIIENTLAAVEKMKSAVDTMDQILQGQRGNLEETIANIRETSANMVELTRSLKERPWSLVRQTKPRKDGGKGPADSDETSSREGVERNR